MRKSPKWNGRFRKLMENGRLIHKFFPIGSFLSENQTILGDLYRHFSKYLGDELKKNRDVFLLEVFCTILFTRFKINRTTLF